MNLTLDKKKHFHPDKPLTAAHRNAIKKARTEDLSYHRKVSQSIIDKQAISFDGLKSNGNKLKHLVSMVRQIYFLENPFEASDSHLATAVWMDECRKLYQEQLAKMERKETVVESAAPMEPWSDQRIAELKLRIKKARLGGEISRKLGTTAGTISQVLGGLAKEKARAKWLPRIEAALNELQSTDKLKRNTAISVAPAKAYAVEADMDRSIVSFPIVAPSLISAMMVDIQDGRLKVTMEVDVREAVRLYAQQLPMAGQ